MGFVDCNAGELALFIYGFQMPTEDFCEAELGCDVEKAGAWVTATEVLHDGIAVWSGGFGVDGSDCDVCGLEGGDLVFHEGQERGDDDGDAMVDYGRELEAEALAKGGGRLDEDIAAFEGGGDDFALVGSGDY